MINIIDSGYDLYDSDPESEADTETFDRIQEEKREKENKKNNRPRSTTITTTTIKGIEHYYCNTCEVYKPIEFMLKNKRYLCWPCDNERRRAAHNTLQGAIHRLYTNSKGSTKTRAKANIEHRDTNPGDIDEPFLHQLYKDQGGRCAISGMPLDTNTESVWKMSLERIDPFIGYMKNNVSLICKLFQSMDNSVRMIDKIEKRKKEQEKKKQENTEEEDEEEDEKQDKERDEDSTSWTHKKFLIFFESYTRNFM
jgi:hypothetical protein